MYTLKTIARRGTALGMATALLVAAVMPAASVFAQQVALNPLTERSLLLSSSAPGFIDTDGSGYSTTSPNPASVGNPGTPGTFAPAGSGPNGMKTGQTFSFRLSSGSSPTTALKGLSFQYCTTAAGNCQAPGDNGGDFRDGVKADGAYASPNTYDENTGELTNNNEGRETNDQGHPNERSDLDFVDAFAPAGTGDPDAGEFQIYVNDVAIDSTGWLFEKDQLEDEEHSGPLTGKNNYVTLSHETGLENLNAGDYVKVVFQASETAYITNPGSGHFFVKINTYSANGMDAMFGAHNQADAGLHNIIDGGVTVANVMTDSIHITTKVLETMAFSVGTQNRDTMVGPHGTCDPINQANNNRLNLGNPDAEYSLETTRAWDVYSYWRLSSNSSGGATVYYSGNTLANTVGDEIAAMTDKDFSIPGTEQFGLGFVDPSVLTAGHDGTLEAWDPAFYNPDYVDGNEEPTPQTPGLVQDPAQNGRYKLPSSFPFVTHAGQAVGDGDFSDLTIAQSIGTDYRDATGTIFDDSGATVTAGTAQFKFDPTSLTDPEPIAQQNETVISCATAKMRYVGNIAADTPAGVYTTKVNYLAAPQY